MSPEHFTRVYDARYKAEFSQIVKENNEFAWFYVIFDSKKFIYKGEAETKEMAKQKADKFVNQLKEK